MSVFEALVKDARERKLREGRPDAYSEMRRIRALPTVRELTAAETDCVSKAELKPDAYATGERLFPVQAAHVVALDCFDLCVWDGIGVGYGKTGCSILSVERAARKGLARVLLLVPSSGLSQFFQYDLRFWDRLIGIKVPYHNLGGKVSVAARNRLASSGKHGCYVLPYGVLQTRTATDIVERIAPDMIVADEAHKLADAKAATTGRIMRYAKARREAGQRVRFVAQSGTFTSNSIKNYDHLIAAVLGPGSPLPLVAEVVEAWALVLDAAASPSPASREPCLPLVEWARQEFPRERHRLLEDQEGFRHAYRLRLTSAPGVVATGDAEIPTSLQIINRPVPKPEDSSGWGALRELDRQVVEDSKTPNGDIIEHAILKYGWRYQLAAGFYYRLTWPKVAVLAAQRKIPESGAVELLERALDHHEAQQTYKKELGDWLARNARGGLDSPWLAANHMQRYRELPTEHGKLVYTLWRAMKDLEFDGMPVRDHEPVRICPFKVDHAAAWVDSLPDDEGAIIWFLNDEIGQWLREVVGKRHPERMLYCPAGESGNQAIRDEGNAKRIAIASIKAHGEQKNLQHFGYTLYVQWPRPSKLAQQSLGRTHRSGQTRPEIVVTTMNTVPFDHELLAATLNDACYVHQTTPDRQRLLIARFDPIPETKDGRWLREHGYQPQHQLSADMQKLLAQRFSK
jgi:hypothetical protein